MKPLNVCGGCNLFDHHQSTIAKTITHSPTPPPPSSPTRSTTSMFFEKIDSMQRSKIRIKNLDFFYIYWYGFWAI